MRRKARAVVDVVEGAVARGGHARGRDQLLHVRLRALDLGTVGARAEHDLALRPQAVGQPVHERLLGADHEQVGLELLGRRVDRPGIPGLPGRDDDVVVRRQHERQAGLPPPDPTTTTVTCRAHAGSWTYWSRPGPTPRRRIGTPTCCSRKAT